MSLFDRLAFWFARTVLCIQVEDDGHTFRLPAWCCTSCGAFNGEAKETLHRCRCCDARRP